MSPEERPDPPATVYDLVGGLGAFVELVETFYARVEQDDLLRPHYPEDLGPGKRRLAMFLAQYWGAGPIYNQERGHPRLRMRHAPFAIDHDTALRWAELMAASVVDQGWPEPAERAMLEYVAKATPTMINTFPEPPPGRRAPMV